MLRLGKNWLSMFILKHKQRQHHRRDLYTPLYIPLPNFHGAYLISKVRGASFTGRWRLLQKLDKSDYIGKKCSENKSKVLKSTSNKWKTAHIKLSGDVVQQQSFEGNVYLRSTTFGESNADTKIFLMNFFKNHLKSSY